MIYFDFDGVIRNLTVTISDLIFTDWDTQIEGKSFLEYFNENLNLLLEASPTEYYLIIKDYQKEIVVMTHQADNWKDAFWQWMKTYFPERRIEVIFVEHINDKLGYLNQDDLLIEDYPNFDDYSQIILIKRPYNRNVENAFMFIDQPEQLQKFLEDN